MQAQFFRVRYSGFPQAARPLTRRALLAISVMHSKSCGGGGDKSRFLPSSTCFGHFPARRTRLCCWFDAAAPLPTFCIQSRKLNVFEFNIWASCERRASAASSPALCATCERRGRAITPLRQRRAFIYTVFVVLDLFSDVSTRARLGPTAGLIRLARRRRRLIDRRVAAAAAATATYSHLRCFRCAGRVIQRVGAGPIQDHSVDVHDVFGATADISHSIVQAQFFQIQFRASHEWRVPLRAVRLSQSA
ncbi:hypothetical protein B0H15DRAFT_567629 [Mycena belliarum]|uniref:Uncharacterized protein n=1 Tax=Mycena belliarum TaxID=1033014 RepID=A0AAD6TTH4_9AGAR|nr:hypothetical protein B0H15DRAFT_567217 [Mycena belliae]KAJ7077110.1 hypothetical protein B0H15DRAFT_567629 [Mycena belliae]